MLAELSHDLLLKIHYDMSNVIWSAYKMLKFNLKARCIFRNGVSSSLWYISDKFDDNYDELVNILLYSGDNVLKLCNWRITYCNTELCLHLHNTILYELIQ